MTTPKRPRDTNQLAKMVVDIAAGDAEAPLTLVATENGRGRPGGLKGGPARALALDPDTRKRIAAKAASNRWKKGQAAPEKKESV